MAGPKNPEQLRGALGAIRRRLQEVEVPKPSLDMRMDTGLDPSKAPVPVSPRFQAPAIPEMPAAEPSSPFKGVEDVANRVLNQPVDRRQFLEGARSGAAALSQIGKFGQLGRIMPPERPPEDVMPQVLDAVGEFFNGGHGDDVDSIIEGISEHLDFERGVSEWSYDGEPYLDQLRDFVKSKVKGVKDEDLDHVEDLVDGLAQQYAQTHFIFEDGRAKEAFRSLFELQGDPMTPIDQFDVPTKRDALLKPFYKDLRERVGEDQLEGFLNKNFEELNEKFSTVYDDALELYKETTEMEKWPQWLKDYMQVDDYDDNDIASRVMREYKRVNNAADRARMRALTEQYKKDILKEED